MSVQNQHRQPTATADQATMDRIVGILRHDLKLGNDAVIGPQTPLLGGDHDLDSLDILLMLTSLEKEFGIKIPNEAVRQDAFTNVATLALYVDQKK